MAATEGMVTLTANTWTLVTGADTTAIRIQNVSGHRLWLKATVGVSAPSGVPQSIGAILLPPGAMIDTSKTFANLFPGAGAVTRIYAYAIYAVDVPFSHP